MTTASTRTRDKRTEARTGPGPLYPRNGKRPHTIQGTCIDTRTGLHEDPLTASSGRPSDERVTGSDQPQSSHVLYGTSGGSHPSHDIGVHISSLVSSMCVRAKDHLRTPSGGLPEPLRSTTRPVRQRSGLAVTEDWRPGRRRAI